MLSAFTNSLKIPELRRKIFVTLALLFIARIGANIPLPGMNMDPIQNFFADRADAGGGIVGMFNMFTGGALLNGAVFALGIMPYISASIIMQLLGAVYPTLARLQQEGDVGRQKINQYTRYLTLGICVVQGLLLLVALSNNPASLIEGFSSAEYGQIVIASKTIFLITGTIFLTVGTMIMVWLGEQITKEGIGNGISLLITVSIISSLPGAVRAAYRQFVAPVGSEGGSLGLPEGVLMLALLFVVTAALVAITQAQRKVPVQYAKRVIGRKVYSGQSSFLPLKVNYAGVMPVIFGSAVLMFPTQILTYLGSATDMHFFNDFADSIKQGQPAYYILFALLILLFSYLWVSMMFKPVQIADDLKKNSGYIPGVRPGEPTAKFLDHIMTRLTLFGVISLILIAIFPDFLYSAYDVPFEIALFFGGTGMLITVGVLLDTMRQIETYLLQRHYDGFLKKGKIRGRSVARNKQFVDTASLHDFWVVWRPLLFIAVILFTLGLVSWAMNTFGG